MPFLTPAYITISVSNVNIIKHISAENPPEIKSVKELSPAKSLLSPTIYSARYLITQPPITE